MAEKICEEYHHFFGLSTCSLRIFSAFGPGLKKQLLWELYHKAKMSDTITLFGTGDETRDYIFIDDIMRALEVVLLNARFDAAVYNLASGSAKSTKWMANCLLQSVGWRGALNFSGSKRTGDPDNWTADITLLNTLGFHPMITTEEGIKYYAEWLLSLA
jgi:dTDP-glucose 4,6-dehydratase/UDP-glucose 4-epimerase